MKFMKNDEGFTGLEAAIVLIAFVVVAAVFSYVVLGAGFFTTQKSQEAVHTGVQQASSSVEVVGEVYGLTDTNTAANLTNMTFTIALTSGGTSADVSKLVMTLITEKATEDLTYNATGVNAGYWNLTKTLNTVNNGTLLEPGEQMVVSVDPSKTAAAALTPNTAFILELKPAVGAVMPISRTVPASLAGDTVFKLY